MPNYSISCEVHLMNFRSKLTVTTKFSNISKTREKLMFWGQAKGYLPRQSDGINWGAGKIRRVAETGRWDDFCHRALFTNPRIVKYITNIQSL